MYSHVILVVAHLNKLIFICL